MEWLLPLGLLVFPFGSALLVMLAETVILRRRFGAGFTLLLLRTERLELEPARVTLARGTAALSSRLPKPLARRWAAALLHHGTSYARRAKPRMGWVIVGTPCPTEVDVLTKSWTPAETRALLAKGLVWFDARGQVEWRLNVCDSVPGNRLLQIGTHGNDHAYVMWDCGSGEVIVRGLGDRDLRFLDISQFVIFVYWWAVLRAAYPHLSE